MNKLILALIPVILLAGCTTPGSTFYYFYDYDKIPVEPVVINPEWTVDISFTDTTLCVGDTVTGFIDSNIPNGFCRIRIDTGTGWKTDSDIALDASGDYSESRTVNTAGAVNLMAVCSDAELETFARSNTISLTIEACADTKSSCCKYMNTYDCFVGLCPVGWNTIKVYSTDETCHTNCHATSQCTDTDNGDFIFTFGTCTDSSGSTSDVCPLGDFSDYISEANCGTPDCIGYSTSCYSRQATCYQGKCISWNQDSDSDGYTDLEELDLGTDPNDASSTPETEIDCDYLCGSSGYPFGGYFSGGISCDDFEHYISQYQCCCYAGPEETKSCDEWVIELLGSDYDGFCGDSNCVDWQGTSGTWLGNSEADAFCGVKCCYYTQQASECEIFARDLGFTKFAEQPYCENLAVADCQGGYTMQNYPSMNCCMWRCT